MMNEKDKMAILENLQQSIENVTYDNVVMKGGQAVYILQG